MSGAGHSPNPEPAPDGERSVALPRPLAADAPIALVGMMAAGKTAVGGHLAALLGRRFLDTDLIIADRAGAAVAELFAREGEAGFRARERALAAELGGFRGHVLALGGGMFASEENVTVIRGAAFTVWLDACVETLVSRLDQAGRDARPLLAGEEPAIRLTRLLAERRPFYARAHLTVPTDGRSAADVARAIALALACA